MREKTITVYNFSELSPEAKQTVKNDWRENNNYVWAVECLESIKALAREFGCKIEGYTINWENESPSYMTFSAPQMERADIEAKLRELGGFDPKTFKGAGDCVMTGFSADEDALDGFRAAFYAGESSLEKLMDAAFESWIAAAQKDAAAFFEDEAFGDFCDENEYEFLENGKLA